MPNKGLQVHFAPGSREPDEPGSPRNPFDLKRRNSSGVQNHNAKKQPEPEIKIDNNRGKVINEEVETPEETPKQKPRRKKGAAQAGRNLAKSRNQRIFKPQWDECKWQNGLVRGEYAITESHTDVARYVADPQNRDSSRAIKFHLEADDDSDDQFCNVFLMRNEYRENFLHHLFTELRKVETSSISSNRSSDKQELDHVFLDLFLRVVIEKPRLLTETYKPGDNMPLKSIIDSRAELLMLLISLLLPKPLFESLKDKSKCPGLTEGRNCPYWKVNLTLLDQCKMDPEVAKKLLATGSSRVCLHDQIDWEKIGRKNRALETVLAKAFGRGTDTTTLQATNTHGEEADSSDEGETEYEDEDEDEEEEEEGETEEEEEGEETVKEEQDEKHVKDGKPQETFSYLRLHPLLVVDNVNRLAGGKAKLNKESFLTLIKFCHEDTFIQPPPPRYKDKFASDIPDLKQHASTLLQFAVRLYAKRRVDYDLLFELIKALVNASPDSVYEIPGETQNPYRMLVDIRNGWTNAQETLAALSCDKVAHFFKTRYVGGSKIDRVTKEFLYTDPTQGIKDTQHSLLFAIVLLPYKSITTTS
ncbi:hypothetical protein ABW19_dt0204704 [Dactylella cylindrospora]|nr:hypothetical protein ABW19_dt0204704 [Dactylella cylindrospora]